VKNVLVTGMTGFVGAHLTALLAEDENVHVHGLSRRVVSQRSTFSALGLDKRPNVTVLLGSTASYTDVERVLATFEIDEVYHLAAQAIVRSAAESPLDTIRTNVMGAVNVLEAVRVVGRTADKEIPVLVMSSDKAYGHSDVLPYVESMPLNGADIYSASKAAEDVIVRAFAVNYGIPVVVARPCNIYGPLDFHWSRLVPRLAQAYFGGGEILRYEGGEGDLREYMYVEDAVRALVALLRSHRQARGLAFNVGTGEVATTELVEGLFKAAARVAGSTVEPPVIVKRRGATLHEIQRQQVDASRLHSLTGWVPKWDLSRGLTVTARAYKDWFSHERSMLVQGE
jgi:CDP-glucose 4,6-dehydratase